ncbi:CaiB/BaiF CoA transferase family protein [Parahaliea mediterranea]|uniref:CoA transferase n=1 Tax=Parahaliea mediterranea TaxID=651086 RepID=A0A939DG65_9GAMM|nr:CoA transferase [Parahaliea mediterranea]MBN7797500.1 CoA transferase [Parahaliea mediterranea]
MNGTTRQGPMNGVRIVELGLWIAGPAATGILADWGAEVIKIEPPRGDPARSAMESILGIKGQRSPAFDVDNRGKRSVVLDLQAEEGKGALMKLLATADVFATNVRPAALERLGLQPEKLRAEFPALIIAQVTGYGSAGPDENRPGYDSGGFWAYSGLAHQFSGESGYPPLLVSAMGDHLTGITLASGIAGALYGRTQSGTGCIVETSLLKTGIYAGASDFSLKLGLGFPQLPISRAAADAPLVNCYKSADNRAIWLLGVEGPRHWPIILKALDIEHLADDERFVDVRSRYKNRRALVAEFDKRFAEKDFEAWSAILDEQEVFWSPVNNLDDVIAGEQAAAIGAFPGLPAEGEDITTVGTPIDFDRRPTVPQGPTPALGADTEEVLAELGLR